MHSKQKGMVKGTLPAIGGNIYFAVLSYLVIVVVARHLGPEKYGLYVFALAVLSTFELITAEAFGNPLIKACSRQEYERLNQLQVFHTRFALSNAVFLGLVSFPISYLLGDSNVFLPLLVSSLDIIPFALFIRYCSLLIAQGYHQLRFIAFGAYATGKLVFMCGLALLTEDIALVILGMVISSTLSALIAYALYRRVQSNSPFLSSVDKKTEQRNISSQVGSNELPLSREMKTAFLFSLAAGILNNGDVWALKLAGVASTSLGAYGAAVSLVKAAFLFIAAVAQVLIPRVASTSSLRQVWTNDRQFRVTVYQGVALLLGGCVTCHFIAHPLTLLLFGPQYINAVTFVSWLPLFVFPLILGFYLAQLFFHCRLAEYAGLVLISASAVLLVTSYFGTVAFGPFGAMIGPLCAGLLLLAALLHRFKES